MEAALSKIRPHTASSLPHQKIPATLLLALEATLDERHTERTPTAYFATLLTILDGSIQKNEISLGDGDVLPAELYLMAFIAPFVPQPVVRVNLDTVLSLTAPLFPLLIHHAPPLRSQLSLYHAILRSLDRSQLEIQGIRQCFASILELCLDPRPKVRKKAADIVQDVLAAPPPPLARHPYAQRVGDWVQNVLSEVNLNPLSKYKDKSQTTTTETALHLLAFLRPILPNLPPSLHYPITTLLLILPKLGNPYLSQSVYNILSVLFSTTLSDESNVHDQIPDVLKAVLSSPPIATDITLAAAWLDVLGSAMDAYSLVDLEAASNEVGKAWKLSWPFLSVKEADTRKAAVRCLDLLSHCFSPALIEAAVKDTNSASTVKAIIDQITKALGNLAFARSMPELLSLISSLITALQYRPTGGSTATEHLLIPLIQKVGELRTAKRFEYKECADVTLAAAMRVLGPKVLLEALPLNIEPADRQAGREPRAYLLPLLSQPHRSPLGHFVSYFVPLSERMFDLQQKAEEEGRQSEAKVWSVLIAQIWAGLVGYCHVTPDLKEALNPTFSQLLSGLLYGQPELRPSILKALKTLVDSNAAFLSPNNPAIPPDAIVSPELVRANLEFLRSQVESWLAVFFNIFNSVSRDARGMVGDVITSWLSIAGEQEIAKAYAKVIQLFKANLPNANTATQQHGEDKTDVATTAQDILILLLPYLNTGDASALFQLCLSVEVIGTTNNAVQKRGYKILVKVVQSGKVSVEAISVLQQLDGVSENLTPAAKKDQFHLLALLIPLIPSSSLHVIPSLIPEAVLGTKEPSEKARAAAFELIVTMGHKMSHGGIVKRGMVDGMDEDDASDATANIEEFMTMMAAGLAGASPHMISATVTAVSRLVFEFKDAISPKMHLEIFNTMLVFLSSANREIVKSTLGFVKLIIHTLPVDLLRPHLKELVTVLLGWSHDHKNHFKVKVRHIFERMIRRFGWDEVYSCAGEAEAAKVLVNIKKRKDRAKRKKASKVEEEDELPPAVKPTAGVAFEDVLYGSESELEDSDDDMPGQSKQHPGQKKHHRGAQIRVDGDEPMDLLQGAASGVATTQASRRRKPGQDAAHFKTDETGKMVINENSDSEQENANVKETGNIGTAYRESITSVDGFTRGPNGRIKFNKDTKKRRRENEEIEEDVEMADVDIRKAELKKKKPEPKLGYEFKAKRAGGDVKKGGMDPYAYVSLSQAAKKGTRRNISIVKR